jgi:hypothetical protein
MAPRASAGRGARGRLRMVRARLTEAELYPFGRLYGEAGQGREGRPRRYCSRLMPPRQKYRLRARSDREVVREVEPGMRYMDHETGEELRVVGALLPLAPSPSDLPYAVENLRLCGCSLEQLVQKDLNDCPHCGRRLPAVGS